MENDDIEYYIRSYSYPVHAVATYTYVSMLCSSYMHARLIGLYRIMKTLAVENIGEFAKVLPSKFINAFEVERL